jgi:hypothetical protein
VAKVKPHYYRIRSQEGQNKYLISKLDQNFEVMASYLMYDDFENKLTCNCPSRKRPCKHVAYLEAFTQAGQINGPEIYDAVSNRFIRMEDVL